MSEFCDANEAAVRTDVGIGETGWDAGLDHHSMELAIHLDDQTGQLHVLNIRGSDDILWKGSVSEFASAAAWMRDYLQAAYHRVPKEFRHW